MAVRLRFSTEATPDELREVQITTSSPGHQPVQLVFGQQLGKRFVSMLGVNFAFRSHRNWNEDCRPGFRPPWTRGMKNRSTRLTQSHRTTRLIAANGAIARFEIS